MSVLRNWLLGWRYPRKLIVHRQRYRHGHCHKNVDIQFNAHDVFVVHKTSNCLFTTETEFYIYLLNLGKMLIIRSLYWHMLSDIIIRRIQEVLLLYTWGRRVRLMVFNVTFNNISAISWRSFFWRRNRRNRRKPPTCRKSLTNFIT